jgi:hypothetical protein
VELHLCARLHDLTMKSAPAPGLRRRKYDAGGASRLYYQASRRGLAGHRIDTKGDDVVALQVGRKSTDMSVT